MMKDYLKGFMNLEIGQEGMKMSFSKFGLILLFIVLLSTGYSAYKLVMREISQRNIEIEKHRKINEELKKMIKEKELIIEKKNIEIEKKDLEIEELSEYKNLIDAVKELSMNILDKDEQTELVKVIWNESKKYKYNWRMIIAVVMTESSFRPNIKSTDPSYGLMQIKFNTAKSASDKVGINLEKEEDLFNITTNIRIGGFYLWEQILRFGDVKKAIVAYNLGPTKTSKISKEKKGEEISTDYLEKVLRRYQYLEKKYSYNNK